MQNRTMTSPTLSVTTEQQRAAKVAGISALLATAIVIVGNYVLLAPLIVSGKAAETAQNILAHEGAFRLTVDCFLLYSEVSVILVSALYVILEPVNRVSPGRRRFPVLSLRCCGSLARCRCWAPFAFSAIRLTSRSLKQIGYRPWQGSPSPACSIITM